MEKYGCNQIVIKPLLLTKVCFYCQILNIFLCNGKNVYKVKLSITDSLYPFDAIFTCLNIGSCLTVQHYMTNNRYLETERKNTVLNKYHLKN